MHMWQQPCAGLMFVESAGIRSQAMSAGVNCKKSTLKAMLVKMPFRRARILPTAVAAVIEFGCVAITGKQRRSKSGARQALLSTALLDNSCKTHPESHSSELAIEVRQHLADSLGSSSRARNDVGCCTATTPPVLG